MWGANKRAGIRARIERKRSMGKRSGSQPSIVEGISNNQRIPGTWREIIVSVRQEREQGVSLLAPQWQNVVVHLPELLGELRVDTSHSTEQKALIRMEKDKARMTEVFFELDDDSDGFVSVPELRSHSELDPDADGSFTEAEVQGLLGGVDKVDTTAFESVWNNIKEKYMLESNADTPAPEETSREEINESDSDNESDQYPDDDIPEDVEDDDEEDEDDDHDEQDYKIPPTTRTEEKKDDDEGTMPPYDQETQNLIDAAQKARDEFDEAERALREVDDQIRNLEKEISFDVGPTSEFAYLYSQCYELTTSEYIYRLCPFNRVTQKPKYGGSETNLGTWGKWAGPEDNIYSVMKYEHGTGCWQGPSRSTTVKITCGKETVVTSTSEPSRCEYLMEFTSPAICQEPPSLDSLNHERHEEL